MFALVTFLLSPAADPPDPRTALQPFNVLVGSWKGTGTPEGGPRTGRQAGTWTEAITWEWRIKAADAKLVAAFDRGKHFKSGELRYNPGKRIYQLAATTPGGEVRTYAGTLKDGVLTLDRIDPSLKEEERLVVSLLHHNRHLYRLEVRPVGSPRGFVRVFQVGATKEGVAFADVPKGQECVVSGGPAAIRVTHQGTDYYVCCSGCRDAFKDDPEKFIKEAAAKAKK